MRKIILASALLVAPIAANAADAIHFEREGYKVDYTITPQADGSQIIKGTELTSREPFTFHLQGRNVTGDVGGRPVSFLMTKAQAAQLAGH